jgi:acyl-CoA reductase-like NAD-dependent aldehyde dehydrogenase
MPVGVCAQIIAWTFPILTAAEKLAPVLATGCVSVLKPHEDASLAVLKMGEILAESGLPDGVVNIIPGLGDDAGKSLVEHSEIDKIFFTGSPKTGKQILK